ncbi:hypothetical protein, partial [Burkholderia lata]|uniref:hypothetical protein n=1 Tax=Burkholderia lata (strain ATCC 17760 / DSM 23089 / LMG 22485 / NCIMB 9086 / R18194 / 383) TaxID=482957 RepID=UPI00242D4620
MTVPVQEPTVTYTGNGVTTSFTYPFRIIQDADLTITVDDATPPVPPTITGIGDLSGGSVVFATAPVVGAKVVLFRSVELERFNDYQDNGDLLADTVNSDFDRLWMALQSFAYLTGSGDPSLARALLLGRSDVSGSGAYRANGNRISNLGAAQTPGDATNLQDLLTRIADFAADGSGQAVVARLADSTLPANGAGMVGYSGAVTVKSYLDSLRVPVTVGPTFYVDASLGIDSDTCGLGPGSQACRTIQRAFNNLAIRYDLRGVVPRIVGPAGQVHTSGLNLQGGQQTSPFLTGINQLVLDLNGSTINSTDNNAIFLRGYPLWLVLQNMQIAVSGTKGNLVEVYGGGTHVEFNGGMTFGACPAPYAQLSATRFGRISTRPQGGSGGGTGYSIVGGGGIFAEAIINGRIELEGQTINIGPGVSYSVAFASADSAGALSFHGLPFTGSNVTGPQFNAAKMGLVDIAGQTGSFTAVPGNSYLPGSIAGQMGFCGGRISEPGLPSLDAASVTAGAIVQRSEPAF